MLKRRLCDDPKAATDGDPTGSSGKNKCPDIWELEDGSFMVIGTDRTSELEYLAGQGIYLDESERIVVIPRHTLISARGRIPAE